MAFPDVPCNDFTFCAQPAHVHPTRNEPWTLTPDERALLSRALWSKCQPVLCSKCNSPTSEIGDPRESGASGLGNPGEQQEARQQPAGGAYKSPEYPDWFVVDYARRGAEIARLQRIIQKLGKKNRILHRAMREQKSVNPRDGYRSLTWDD